MMLLKYFTSQHCGPCRRFGPVVDLFKLDHPTVTITKIDTADPRNRDECAKEGVTAIPTVAVYKNGVKVSQFSGAKDIDFMKALIETWI